MELPAQETAEDVISQEERAAKEAEDNPFPNDETTPPVTKTYRAMEEHYNKLFCKNKDKLLL